MRIVLINDASVAKGGATGLTLASARWFRQRGIPVTLIVGDGGANEEMRDLGVEIVPVGNLALVNAPAAASLVRGLYNARAARVIRRWIADNDRPGFVYHLHGWSKILSPSVFTALAPVRDRLVVSAHDFFLVCPNGAYMDFPAKAACRRVPLGAACLTTNCDKRNYPQKLWRVARQAIANVARQRGVGRVPIVAIHDAMGPLLELGGIAGDDIVVLRNPVVPFRAERIPAEANRTLVFIGRLDPEKGPDLAALAAREAGARLRIIGDGPLRERIAGLHPEVEMMGWRSREEIAELVRDARLLLMPSRYPEPFGLVAVEALWSGLPVALAAESFLAPEIVRAGVGEACDPTQTAIFAQTLRRWMGDDDRVRAMSERAFADTAWMASTPDAWVDGLITLYQKRVRDSARPAGSLGSRRPAISAR